MLTLKRNRYLKLAIYLLVRETKIKHKLNPVKLKEGNNI
jgi:hypothetical protein